MLLSSISWSSPIVLHGAAGGLDELVVYGAAGVGLLIVVGVALFLRRGKTDSGHGGAL